MELLQRWEADGLNLGYVLSYILIFNVQSCATVSFSFSALLRAGNQWKFKEG